MSSRPALFTRTTWGTKTDSIPKKAIQKSEEACVFIKVGQYRVILSVLSHGVV